MIYFLKTLIPIFIFFIFLTLLLLGLPWLGMWYQMYLIWIGADS